MDQVDVSALGSMQFEKKYIFPCFSHGLMQNPAHPQALYLLDRKPSLRKMHFKKMEKTKENFYEFNLF